MPSSKRRFVRSLSDEDIDLLADHSGDFSQTLNRLSVGVPFAELGLSKSELRRLAERERRRRQRVAADGGTTASTITVAGREVNPGWIIVGIIIAFFATLADDEDDERDRR